MDGSNVQLMNTVDTLRRRMEEEDSVHPLQKFLGECRHDPEYVARLGKMLIPTQETHRSDVCEVFSNFFLQCKLYDDMASVLSLWMGILAGEYRIEECMRFVKYFDRAYEDIPYGVRFGNIYEKVSETLLSLSWLLNRNGAFFESYVVCEKICEMITGAGRPSSKTAAISYLELLCDIFISSNMLFSYINAVGTLVSLDSSRISGQCSLDDLRLLSSYAEIKNEGDKHRKLFCKIKFSTAGEVVASVEDKCSGMEVQEDTLVRRRFDFEMWEMYVGHMNKAVPIESSMDLIAFMRKNDLQFSVRDGMVVVGGYEYKTIERKIFEIVDSYEERVRVVTKTTGDERMRKQEARLEQQAEAGKPMPLKKTTKFKDRFISGCKKMELYGEYGVEHSEGVEDLWYDRRNLLVRRGFESAEEAFRERRERLRTREDTVEKMRRELSKKIEETSERVRTYVPEKITVRSTHWRDEVDDAPETYRSPYQHRSSKVYVPPLDTYRHTSSRYVPPSPSSYSSLSERLLKGAQQEVRDPCQRSKASRSNSWYSDDSKQQDTRDN